MRLLVYIDDAANLSLRNRPIEFILTRTPLPSSFHSVCRDLFYFAAISEPQCSAVTGSLQFEHFGVTSAEFE